ncbi:MAG: hypothetical protein OEV42_03430 [Deltaproteobacteria bacterium]|nr:hypothetical protein [Deltaproteobacteria bacterium]
MRYLIIVLILLPNFASACFCTAPTELTDEIVKNSDIVFKGTISNIDFEGAHNRVTFKIKEMIKGKQAGNVTIEFDTFSSCAIQQEFALNEHYLISAIKKKITGSSKGELPKLYESNLCSLQKKLKDL